MAQASLKRRGIGAVNFSDSPDYEDSGLGGAFVGVSWEPTPGMIVDLEAQVRSGISGGIAFNWNF